ncbi:MAG: hypothetical protein LBG84_04115 [Treponema sp.]|jgi:hypothetical protein|nr:hypothetical protein [Treponema sp.]
MTLAQRNRYFKGGIILSSLCLLFLIVQMGKLLPLYPEVCGRAIQRSSGIFQNLAVLFLNPAPLAPFVTAAASVVYALAASALVFFFFEKTQSPEILFFGLFALSFVFEILRLMVPLRELYQFPAVFLIPGTRILIFGRFFGVLSLFASSVYAAGLEIQKHGSVIIASVLAVLVISLRVPVSGLSWDSSLTMVSGYSAMFRFAEDSVTVITLVSFLAAIHIRGNGEYLAVTLGALLVSLGRGLLINADNWVALGLGLITLTAGTWLITTRLHQVYLWL